MKRFIIGLSVCIVSCSSNKPTTIDEKFEYWANGIIEYTAGYAKSIKTVETRHEPMQHYTAPSGGKYSNLISVTFDTAKLQRYITKNADKLDKLERIYSQNHNTWGNAGYGDDADLIKAVTDFIYFHNVRPKQHTVLNDSIANFPLQVLAKYNFLRLEKITNKILLEKSGGYRLQEIMTQAVRIHLMPPVVEGDLNSIPMPGYATRFNDSTATFYLYTLALNYQVTYRQDTMAIDTTLMKLRQVFNLPQSFVDNHRQFLRDIIYIQKQKKMQ